MPARDALPVLYPGTAVLVRSGRSLHIGSDPRTALILHLDAQVSAPRVVSVLQRLRVPRRYLHVRREVRSSGLTATGFWEILDRLVAAGKAVEAPGPPAGLRVGVVGHGELARLLRDGLPRDGHPTAACDPRGPLGPPARRPQLVVIADQPVPDPALWHPLMTAGVPHLAVHVRDDIGIVGPLVLPGLTSCLQCIDHHRTDDDPCWPVLAATLQGIAGGSSIATRLSTAALAHAQIAEVADRLRTGDPEPPSTVGTVFETRCRPSSLRAVPAPVHPRCGCTGRCREPNVGASTILELAAKGHN